MAVYVCSDIHGQKKWYDDAVQKIGEDDALYIIGDVIDRGPDSISILSDMMNRPNVHLILGNHEFMMLNALTERGIIDRNGEIDNSKWADPSESVNPYLWFFHRENNLFPDFNHWIKPANGGMRTYQELTKIPVEKRTAILRYIMSAYVQKVVEVRGQKFCLVHSFPWITDHGIEQEVRYRFEDMGKNRRDYRKLWHTVWDSPWRDDTYVPKQRYHAFTDYIFIIGHVPIQYTGVRRPKLQGNILNIDGGCALASCGEPGCLYLVNLDRLLKNTKKAICAFGTDRR